jgi:hypothetical protein
VNEKHPVELVVEHYPENRNRDDPFEPWLCVTVSLWRRTTPPQTTPLLRLHVPLHTLKEKPSLDILEID